MCNNNWHGTFLTSENPVTTVKMPSATFISRTTMGLKDEHSPTLNVPHSRPRLPLPLQHCQWVLLLGLLWPSHLLDFFQQSHREEVWRLLPVRTQRDDPWVGTEISVGTSLCQDFISSITLFYLQAHGVLTVSTHHSPEVGDDLQEQSREHGKSL